MPPALSLFHYLLSSFLFSLLHPPPVLSSSLLLLARLLFPPILHPFSTRSRLLLISLTYLSILPLPLSLFLPHLPYLPPPSPFPPPGIVSLVVGKRLGRREVGVVTPPPPAHHEGVGKQTRLLREFLESFPSVGACEGEAGVF